MSIDILISFLKNNNVKTFLDIGAHEGDLSFEIKNKNIDVFSIEANPNCEQYLKDKKLNYLICCLSDSIKDIEFYTTKKFNSKCTGDSYYKENTLHYQEQFLSKIKMRTNTLDNIFPEQRFDVIKIDTQGSEKDILVGGKNLIKKSKYIILETSLIEYNLNAPLQNEIFDFMNFYNFNKILKLEEHYHDNKIAQEDWLFENRDLHV